MTDEYKDLGKLVAVYGIAPAYLQRAVFIVILSFVFFLATMLVYYIRQNILYFMLSSSFLVIYLVTLFSFVMQRRSVVQIYEGGLRFKKRSAAWDEVESVDEGGTINVRGAKPILLPRTLNDIKRMLNIVRQRSGIN